MIKLNTECIVEYHKTMEYIDGKLYKEFYTLANFLYFKNIIERDKNNAEKRRFNDRQSDKNLL